MTAFHSTSNLRLQVQAAYAGLNNLFPDPDGTLGTWPLVQYSAASLTSDGTKFTAVAGAGVSNLGNQVFSMRMPVTAGQYVKAWYTVTAATSGHTLRTSYWWYDADGKYLSASADTAPTVTSGVSYAPTAQAPAGASLFLVSFTLYKASSSTVDNSASVSFNHVMVSTAATSAALTGAFALVDPIPWTNILSKTHEITIDRHILDVGVLSATIIDATLDPAVSGNLNRGDAVRFQALVSGTWEDVFVGEIDDADVSYRRVSGVVRTSIVLSAVDNIATLANRPSTFGFGSFPYLSRVLQHVGVPFNSNGNRNAQLTTGDWTLDLNAKALDQVARIRDTVLGYAWTDRHNVLNGYDSLNLITNPSATVDASEWASTATLTRDGTYGYGPPGSFKMVTASGTAVDAGYAYPLPGGLPIPVVAGETYLFEAWVFGTGSSELQLSNGTVFATGTAVTLTGTWQKISVIGTAPAGSTVIYPVIRQHSAGAQTLYFDEVLTSLFGCYFTDVPNAGALYEYYRDDIAVGWNRDEVINSVGVNYLRQDAAHLDVEAEGVTYGPYSDQANILQNGARAKSYTIQGFTEDATVIANYAKSILAANKTPARKASQLTVPVKDSRSFVHAATLDLYDLAGVKYSTLLDTRYRITSIHHSITTDKWLATYGFGTDGAVALPARSVAA